MSKYVVIAKKMARLNALRPFEPMTEQLIQDQLMLQWTYNSNAIEGNTLTYKETSFYLLRGLTAKGKSLQEHLEISNHKNAIAFLEETLKSKNFTLTEKFIREIHQVLFQGVDEIKVGFPGREQTLRIVGGEYKKHDNHVLKADGTIHYYSPAVAVPAEMSDLVLWYARNQGKIHPIDLSAKVHHEITRIHPFTDGNGRVARLVMNLILMANNYPPAIIRNDEKEAYYNALENADRGNVKLFTKIIRAEVERTIDAILRIVEGKPSRQQEKHPLYEIRREKGLTQKKLALLSGVEQATISKIESLQASPQEKTLRKLSKVLGVEIKKNG